MRPSLLVFISALAFARAQTSFPTSSATPTSPTMSASTTSDSTTSTATTSASAISAATTSAATTSATTSAATTSASTTSAATTSASTTSATTSAATTSASTTSAATTSASTTSASAAATSGATTSASTISTSAISASTTSASTIPTSAIYTTTTSAATTSSTTLAGITAATTSTAKPLPALDPCDNYNVLDDSWRSIYNNNSNRVDSKLMCDLQVNWVGWYRLFINGQSVQMPDSCVPQWSCGTHAPLWLSGGHPALQDGVVSRSVCGHWTNGCCHFQSNSIRVKACPGAYYVYEFVRPVNCHLAYCLDDRNITAPPVTTVPAPGIFYPFGSAAGDTINPAVDDGSSSVIMLSSTFLFFGRTYQQIYVNSNGHLTFSQASSQYVPYSSSSYGSQDIIAGLWTDLDNRVRGVVSYHQYTSGSVLTRATQDINNHFPNLTFNASWVLVATWNKMPYYSLINTETSFQVVLISGSNLSFVLMNYGDIAATGHRVEAGYDTINSTHYFVIPGSNSGSSISNLRSSSNVNVTGRWAFRVDSGPNTDLLFDPCYNYTVLDNPWRSTDNRDSSQITCDAYVSWVGWYRLFINGQSVQMPDSCVPQWSCSTHAPLWLSGGHPTVQDGMVSRSVCGHWSNNCCQFQSNPIRVKACPGGYYVYEFVKPNACYLAYCAEPGFFYTYGSSAGDTINPAADDGSSSVITLLSPFLFFGRTYQKIYVNNNGHLTFSQALSQFVPYSFPAYGGQDIIAGLWTDLDNRAKGVISYHQYTSGSVLTRATQDINNHFPNLNFNASWVFVATWNKVSYYSLINTETSFQVVLITGSNFSFVLMNYGDIAATGRPVEAGYDTINSTRYFVIPGSNNGSSISNLRSSSNVNVPGRWAFRVDSGPQTNTVNIVGLQGKLASFFDLTDSGNMEIVLQHLKQVLVKNGLPSDINLKLRKVQKVKP